MIARLKKVNPPRTNKMDPPMLLCNAPRPDAGPKYFRGSGLPMPTNGSRTRGLACGIQN